MADPLKIRRESLRWNLLNTLNYHRPYSMHEQRLLEVALVLYPDATPAELRRELHYLEGRALLSLTRQPSGTWFADLTRAGVDLCDYTVDCDPGIARPVKYWSS